MEVVILLLKHRTERTHTLCCFWEYSLLLPECLLPCVVADGGHFVGGCGGVFCEVTSSFLSRTIKRNMKLTTIHIDLNY